jgi:hypothetical protein
MTRRLLTLLDLADVADAKSPRHKTLMYRRRSEAR